MHFITRKGAFTLVAERAGHIQGFVVGQQLRGGMGHIVTIDVRAEARRSGVGSTLMDAAEDSLVVRGCNAVYLETAVNNEPAILFYKRRGYFVLKTIPGYYKGELDALLMVKKLAVAAGGKAEREAAT